MDHHEERHTRPFTVFDWKREDTLDRFAVGRGLPRHDTLCTMPEFGGLGVGTRQAGGGKRGAGGGIDLGRFTACLGQERDRAASRPERRIEPLTAHALWCSGWLALRQRDTEQWSTGFHRSLDA